MRQLADVPILTLVNSGRPCDIHSLTSFQLTEHAQEFTMVGIETILSLAHLIPKGAQCSLINSHINFRIFDKIE